MATESSSDAPRQASPARSFRSRMGTMLRRNSSGFNFTRPSTPGRSESKTSLKVDAALAPPPAPETHVAPSPVAESPAREAAAVAADIPQPPAVVGPSPLVQATVPSPEPVATILPVATSEPQPAPPAESKAAATVETPAPISAPELPHASEPEQPASQTVNEAPQTASPEPVKEELPRPSEPTTTTTVPPTPEPTFTAQPVTVEHGADTFSSNDESKVILQPSVAAVEAIAATASAPALQRVPTEIVEEPHPAPAHAPFEDVDHSNAFAWRDPIPPSTPPRVVSPKASSHSIGKGSVHGAIMASPEMLSSNVSRKGSRSSLASSFGQVVVEANGRRVAVSMPDNDSYTEPRRGRSRASSIR